ncbi:MAG TPA: PIG-L family deacetylase [Terriglobales bacterium]|nr:PIG-L family deacetylase [Terriglobales bacterium]
MNVASLDILAIAAHRDDVEQTCGGTLLKMAQRGRRTGILDFTQGEMGTRGSAEERAAEAKEAARVLQVSWRQALDIPDGRVENTWENRLKVARVVREQRPRVIILPYWQGRHPDHYTASVLGYEACFLAGLAKLGKAGVSSQGSGVGVEAHGFSRGKPEPNEDAALAAVSALPPHRPFKIIYATLYYDVRPTFIVDITEQFEARLQSIYAYKSQFTDQVAGASDFPAHAEIRERVAIMAGFYGLLAGVKYAEPFLQKEVGLVEDLLQIPVKSI